MTPLSAPRFEFIVPTPEGGQPYWVEVHGDGPWEIRGGPDVGERFIADLALGSIEHWGGLLVTKGADGLTVITSRHYGPVPVHPEFLLRAAAALVVSRSTDWAGPPL